MKKNIFFLIGIAISLCLTNCKEKPEVITSGACGANGDHLTWQFTNGVLTISGSGEMADYGHYTVPWAHLREKIKTLIIEIGCTTIGTHAFECCALTSIDIPNSVTCIGMDAFGSCLNVTYAKIGSSVTSDLRYSGIFDSNELKIIDVNSNNPIYSSLEGILYNKLQDTLMACPRGKAETIIIPNSVKTIGNHAFIFCQLTSVEIPNSVIDIGNSAFGGCFNLEKIEIPGSVILIGIESFGLCNSLTTIDVDVSNPNYSSDDGILYNKLQDVLMCCPGAKTETITIPNTVETIGFYAFSRCGKLTSVIIPNSVTYIEDGAFSYCTGLTSVTIGSAVSMIGRHSFKDCTGLKSITCNAPLPPAIIFGNEPEQLSTFDGVPQTTPVYVPCDAVSVYKTSNWGKAFSKIEC